MSDTQNETSVAEREQSPEWEQRFRAARVSLPDWAQDAPHRALFVSNATGTYELYAWDRRPASSARSRTGPTGRPTGC